MLPAGPPHLEQLRFKITSFLQLLMIHFSLFFSFFFILILILILLLLLLTLTSISRSKPYRSLSTLV